MLSAFIWSERRYPAMPLAGQPVHQRFVQPGPLVLGSTLLKSPTPTADRDRTVSRRSEPRSRTALMGEQPNPWDLLQPQDATIRHRTFSIIPDGVDYIFTLPTEAMGEGPAYDGVDKFAPVGSTERHLFARLAVGRFSRYGVITPTGVRLPTVLSSTRSTDRPEFTVISRFCEWCFHHFTPMC